MKEYENEEYNEMITEIDRMENELRDNGYKVQDIECCRTCKNSERNYPEDPRECMFVNKEHKYTSPSVDELGICDKYESVWRKL